MRSWFSLFAIAGLAVGVNAQSLISAKAGLVHYAEGDVLVAGKPVEKKISQFTQMKVGETLATAEGRAEVLLGPGVILRVAENSLVKLTNADISDARVELVRGQVIVESTDPGKDTRTTVTSGTETVWFKKSGAYTITSAPEFSVRTWDGEAMVVRDDKTVNVKAGRFLSSDTDGVDKFNKDDTDGLYRWAKRRSYQLSVASISGARRADSLGLSPAGFGGWFFNPYFNMFTYLPTRGIWNSPFGWQFYSPNAIYDLYYRPPVAWGGGNNNAGGWSPRYDPNLGYSTVPMRTGGPSGGMSSGGGGGGAAPPAAVSRGAAGGGAVGRGGGGRGN